ncbi:MAG TPA: 3-hydroxyacyl-CoA dehydrogenase NAD-binding domain-containing protein, partial [Anaerolineae bacterium]|nr:3-hydroxyacyl-CoA dehydrogenase NAD-binding domain-containing protein [Anaerolineae bacterium]
IPAPVPVPDVVRAGFERARRARPAAFADEAAERRVTLGNLEDDFDQLAQVDWIIEAIIEELEPKQALMARVDRLRRPACIVSSNSSGLPMADIAAGRTAGFRQHFLGTHFFNPPRYMKLLELIPTADTAPDVIAVMTDFVAAQLGKGVVRCKDTPNFIGNRLFSFGNSFAVNYALENGYTVPEVDELTGPLLGRPKTGTFRLVDLIGLDIVVHLAHHLYDLVPGDPYRDILRAPELNQLWTELMTRRWLGNKTGQGFYKSSQTAAGERQFMTLDLKTLTYQVPTPTDFEALKAVAGLEPLGDRVTALLSDRWQIDRGARYVRALLSFELAYAASCAQEIAHDLKSIDEAIRWGFGHVVGPFQLWDLLGVADTVSMIEAAGRSVAPWVKEMLAAGCPTFYRIEADQVTGYYDWARKQYT